MLRRVHLRLLHHHRCAHHLVRLRRGGSSSRGLLLSLHHAVGHHLRLLSRICLVLVRLRSSGITRVELRVDVLLRGVSRHDDDFRLRVCFDTARRLLLVTIADAAGNAYDAAANAEDNADDNASDDTHSQRNVTDIGSHEPHLIDDAYRGSIQRRHSHAQSNEALAKTELLLNGAKESCKFLADVELIAEG